MAIGSQITQITPTYGIDVNKVPQVDIGSVEPASTDIVSERFTEMTDFVDELKISLMGDSGEDGFIGDLMDLPQLSKTYTQDLPNDVTIDRATDATIPTDTETWENIKALFTGITLVSSVPATVSLSAFDASDLSIPDKPGDSPVPSYGDKPTDAFPDEPGDVGGITALNMPPPLEITGSSDLEYPTVPTMTDISIPGAPPGEVLPSFSGASPTALTSSPDTVLVYSEDIYSSDLADATKTKLESDIENGGTGLDSDVEADIWTRARARKDLQNEAMYTEAQDFFSARGFTLPPGALAGRLRDASAEQIRETAQINYEIAIEQARLAQNNTQFAIKSSIDYENALMAHQDKVGERAFRAAVETVDVAIKVYNAKVAYYNSQLAAYQAEGSVFESRMRGALIAIEEYKARLDAARLAGEVNKIEVDLYTAQMAGLNVAAQVYSEQVRGQALVMESEKVRIDAHKALIEAYVAKISGITAKYNLWQAEIAGEKVKADVYATQVNSYAVEASVWEKEWNVKKLEWDTEYASNEQEIKIFDSKVEWLKAQVGKNAATAESIIKKFGIDADIYREAVNLDEAKLDKAAKEAAINADLGKAKMDEALKEAELDLKVDEINRNFDLERLKSITGLYTQMVASGLSAVSAQASLSHSSSHGWSGSYQHSESISNSVSKTEAEQRQDSASNSFTDYQYTDNT